MSQSNPTFNIQGTRSKIDLKLITIEPFDGSTKNGYLDPGAFDWLERLKVQFDLAELLGGQSWPEKVKCSVMASRLTGAAGTWFYRNSATLPTASFRDFGNRFLEHFRCKLPSQAIAVQLAETRKMPAESYAEFAHRLSQIATGLNKGKINSFTEQQALSSFITHAYPKYRTELEAKLHQEADDATSELDEAVELLTRLAKSDGRMVNFKRKSAEDQQWSTNAGDKRQRKVGTAMMAANKSQWDFSDAFCRVCKEFGHTTNFHDRHVALKAKKLTTSNPPAHDRKVEHHG